MREDNKGFTLIEVIVVIAIMGVLVGIGVNTFGIIKNGYAKNGTADIYDLLSKAQYNTQAVQAKSWSVRIYKSGDNYNVQLLKDTTNPDGSLKSDVVEKITLKGDVQVDFKTKYYKPMETGTSELQKTDISDMTITFDKQTGEVNEISVEGTSYDKLGESGTITISSGSFSREIEIYWSTGKVFK